MYSSMVRASSRVKKVLNQINKMSSRDKKQLKAKLVGSARKKEPKKQPVKRGHQPRSILATLTPGEPAGRRMPTLPLFTYRNGKQCQNHQLLKVLKQNPWRYDLPPQFIYNAAGNRVEPAAKWMTTANGRELKPQFVDECSIHDDVVAPNYTNETTVRAFGDVVMSKSVQINNITGYGGLDLKRFRPTIEKKHEKR